MLCGMLLLMTVRIKSKLQPVTQQKEEKSVNVSYLENTWPTSSSKLAPGWTSPIPNPAALGI